MGGLLFCSEGGLFVLIAVSDRGYMMKIQCEGGRGGHLWVCCFAQRAGSFPGF